MRGVDQGMMLLCVKLWTIEQECAILCGKQEGRHAWSVLA
ncbi:hypothetical protein H4W80_011216 [Nonomuraea angiospora]|uniref:Transposase n=1 Tax=Nonomuraea angiospora TaxID=46172 RepID=A0ABR9MJ78_9ACTN|nr:hypothetical protein [Nonomuraea angiospora]